MKILLSAFILIALSFTSLDAQQSDAALRRVIGQDAAGPAALTSAEHLLRAEVYSSNRLFPEARGHWRKVLDNYPGDAGTPAALFGTARSFMWEREYGKAVEWFDKLTKDHLNTKIGREGLAFKAASYVRDGKNLEAARAYEQYVTMFPNGERVETSHLNIIDAYREAGKYDEANDWVTRTVRKFAGKPAEANARHARLRMEIARANWIDAVRAGDELLAVKTLAGSMAGRDEVNYLKAFALESAKQKAEAFVIYENIPRSSYFGSLADRRLPSGDSTGRLAAGGAEDYPVMYRAELLKESGKRKIDPRFLLAIMKQESSFKAGAKSPAGARGLLQFVYDTAIKYNKKAGYANLQPDDLYKPAVSIAIGAVYVAELKDEFDGLYEAVAASYNGGEDNAARWLARSKPKDAGIFAAEIGFAETKNYVFKVMNNYRSYRSLYDENLNRR